MSCDDCRYRAPQPVDFLTHQADMARMERANKRLWILLIIMLALLLVTNAAWIWYEAQYEEESWAFEAHTENGGNAIANGNGEVNYYGVGEGDAP